MKKYGNKKMDKKNSISPKGGVPKAQNVAKVYSKSFGVKPEKND